MWLVINDRCNSTYDSLRRAAEPSQLPDFFFFFFSCSADHERDWPPCKVVFFGLATNVLNVRNNNNNLQRRDAPSYFLLKIAADLLDLVSLFSQCIIGTAEASSLAASPSSRCHDECTSFWASLARSRNRGHPGTRLSPVPRQGGGSFLDEQWTNRSASIFLRLLKTCPIQTGAENRKI